MSIPYYSAFEDRRPPEPLPYNPLREALWQFLAVVTLVIGGWYIAWRWSSSLNPDALWFAALLALADDMREVRTICHCGKKATMVIRRNEAGQAITEGAQVQVGGNETYVSLCRRHWREATGN